MNTREEAHRRQQARERGIQVAREWLETTGSYDMPGEDMWEIAEKNGWPCEPGNLEAHTYIQAVCDELDRLAGLEG